MTPKEIVRAAFEADVSPLLQERGFSYNPSQFAFKRTREAFTQIISITLSHNNSSEDIKFWSALNVTSPRYNAWRKQHEMAKFEGYLGGCMDWNIPGWRPAEVQGTSFDFSEPNRRAGVMRDWLSRCLSVGLPYLESLSTWEGLADDLIRWRWHWGRAADYFVIAGRGDRAVSALETGIRELLAQDFTTSENAHPILVSKKRRQAADRDSEVALYRERIARIQEREQDAPSNGG